MSRKKKIYLRKVSGINGGFSGENDEKKGAEGVGRLCRFFLLFP